jgi:hypothetical protein
MSDHKHRYVLIGGDTVAAMCPQCKKKPRLPASPLTWSQSGIAHLTREEVERRINQEDDVKELVKAVDSLVGMIGCLGGGPPEVRLEVDIVRPVLARFKFTDAVNNRGEVKKGDGEGGPARGLFSSRYGD